MTGTPDLDGIDPDMEGAVRSALRSRVAAVTAKTLRCNRYPARRRRPPVLLMAAAAAAVVGIIAGAVFAFRPHHREEAAVPPGVSTSVSTPTSTAVSAAAGFTGRRWGVVSVMHGSTAGRLPTGDAPIVVKQLELSRE